MLNTVLFDMDGLLIDSEPLWGEAMQEVFAELNIRLTPEHYAQTTGLRTAEVVDHWHRHFGWEAPSPEAVSEDIISRVTGKIQRQGKAMPGVYGLLDFFEQRHFKMGLASSSSLPLIHVILDQLGIRERFGVICSADAESYGKPHPAVYLACARQLGSHPQECLVFEDSVTGMIAAKAARMKVAAVPEPHRQQDPRYALADIQLGSLADFGEEDLKKLEG
ncbi:hexitol phosphatase HxpB [Compostibacter hankyongensis]|uniref:Hexitol phosphatase HxpB n=1 Tax=Compostibacter hankyongensis TaxID=1007089 RepID=A0ABP8FXM5_9BACT